MYLPHMVACRQGSYFTIFRCGLAERAGGSMLFCSIRESTRVCILARCFSLAIRRAWMRSVMLVSSLMD